MCIFTQVGAFQDKTPTNHPKNVGTAAIGKHQKAASCSRKFCMFLSGFVSFGHDLLAFSPLCGRCE